MVLQTAQSKNNIPISIIIDTDTIKDVTCQVSSTNFLELKTDSHIAWEKHIDKVCKKISSGLSYEKN